MTTEILSPGLTVISVLLAEDPWDGDAEFNIAVDDLTLAENQVVKAVNAAGQTQGFDLIGPWNTNASHKVSIVFVNDAYGGSPDKDRNLYVKDVSWQGQSFGGAALYSDGTATITVEPPAQQTQSPPPAAAAPTWPKVPAVAAAQAEVIAIGPDQTHKTLTAGFGYGQKRWLDSNSGAPISDGKYLAPAPIFLIQPGPPGYYDGDVGDHNTARFPSLVNWPTWDGQVYGPAVISGMPGMEPPVLDLGGGANTPYYQGGLFNVIGMAGEFFPGLTATLDDGTVVPVSVLIRGLTIQNFHRPDSQGTWRGLFLEPHRGGTGQSVLALQDLTVTGCDHGFQGGSKGQCIIEQRCRFFGNGRGEPGLTHEWYAGYGDIWQSEDCYHGPTGGTGHHFKSRMAVTTHIRSRALGGPGAGDTSSANYDVPDGGVFTLRSAVAQKGPNADAGWNIHYGGEDQDSNAEFFHDPGSIELDTVLMVGPPVPPGLTRHPGWGITGFSDESVSSGKASFAVEPKATNVSVFGLTAADAGIANATVLSAEPTLDVSSPVKPILPLNLGATS